MTTDAYITCRELIEFLGEYNSGELSSPSRGEIDRHLADCPSCVAYLDGYRRAIALGKDALQLCGDQAPLGSPPPDLLNAVREAMRKAKPNVKP